jgi:HK97 family phage major capsid protein
MATLASLPAEGLPRELVAMINEAARDQSAVARLAGEPIPMGYGETSFLTSTVEPEVQPVAEAGVKPLSNLGYGVKSVTPQKFATVVVVSEEFANANIEGVYDRIVSQLSAAAARGLDLAILHGRNAADGTAIAGVATNGGFVNQTTNEVVLGSGSDTTADLLAGYAAVSEDGFDFTSFAFDPRFRPVLIQARDANGNPTYQSSLDLRSDMGTLLGLPVVYNRTVSGRSRAAAVAETNVRGFGGDWNQLRYGFADRIRIKTSTEATIGGVSMFQTNQIALLVEFTVGWVVNDPNAFVRYVNTATAS